MQLRKIRLKQGLSVPELSRKSLVPIRTIEDIERKDNCKVSTALLLSKALGVTMDELCAEKVEE